MEANELRIGNLIEYFYPHEEEWGTLSVSIEDLEDVHKESFRPIPLTEDWLLKMGFEYRNENKGIGAILDLKKHPENTEVAEWKFHKSVAFVHDKNDEKDVYVTMLSHPTAYKIYYIHQLQNLYFALTGKELTIK